MRRVNAVTGLGYAFTGTSLLHRVLRGVLRPFIRRALAGGDAWTVVNKVRSCCSLACLAKLRYILYDQMYAKTYVGSFYVKGSSR